PGLLRVDEYLARWALRAFGSLGSPNPHVSFDRHGRPCADRPRLSPPLSVSPPPKEVDGCPGSRIAAAFYASRTQARRGASMTAEKMRVLGTFVAAAKASTVEPVVLRASRSRWACAASLRG